MQMNEFLRLLKGVSGSSGQYKAKCPAHDDKDPSLSIGERDEKFYFTVIRAAPRKALWRLWGLA